MGCFLHRAPPQQQHLLLYPHDVHGSAGAAEYAQCATVHRPIALL